MKGKTLLSLAIALVLVLSAMPIFTVKAVTPTVEIVFADGTNEMEYMPCTNFVVTLKVTNTPDITQWIVEITWDANVLELQHGNKTDLVEGPFLKTVGATVFLIPPGVPQPGHIEEMSSAFLGAEKASGTGDLAYLYFHCKAVGDTPITLEQAYLMNGLDLVPSTSVNGLVHQLPPPATPPQAIFTVPSTVDVCTNITLNGLASTPGYDTLPDPGHVCPITIYHWEIDVNNDGVPDWESYDAVTQYHCAGPGAIKIKLTVTAPDMNPPTAPGYVDTSSISKTVLQLTAKLGAKIDVFTCNRGDFNGTGPGMDPDTGEPLPYDFGWSDAYGPQELVYVQAKVTYNDEPVEYKPVGFEMVDESGSSVDYRVAYTDEDGVACTSFRIPWQGSEAEAHFGNWTVYGSVDVAGDPVSDLVQFQFGYLVSINSITVIGSPLHKEETLTVDVDLKSICMTSKDVLVTVVLYDECGVPIGMATTFFTVDPLDGLASGFGITIPRWAFVGTGRVYANVFTDYPSAGGTPMCPEVYTIFTILKT